MKAVLLWMLIATPVFASGMSVCKEWGYGPPPAAMDAGVDDGGSAAREAADAGPSSVYDAGPRRCLRYGFEPYHERGCSSVPGESLVLLALLVARWRR